MAGASLRDVAEGLFGISPLAHRHELTVAPRLPSGWPAAHLRGLPLGAHRLNLRATPEALELEHTSGPQPLTIHYAGHQAILAPGERVTL